MTCGRQFDTSIPLDNILSFPDGFYAHRYGRVYYSAPGKTYRIWYNQTLTGNIGDIFKIEDFTDRNASRLETIKKYSIHTVYDKTLVQSFHDLSKSYHFGHLSVDRCNLIFLSSRDDLSQEYALAMNDSVRNRYLNNSDFELTNSGWFKYIRD